MSFHQVGLFGTNGDPVEFRDVLAVKYETKHFAATSFDWIGTVIKGEVIDDPSKELQIFLMISIDNANILTYQPFYLKHGTILHNTPGQFDRFYWTHQSLFQIAQISLTNEVWIATAPSFLKGQGNKPWQNFLKLEI